MPGLLQNLCKQCKGIVKATVISNVKALQNEDGSLMGP